MTSAEPVDARPTCFIAMPMTTHPHEAERYGGDDEHWLHVMRSLFVPAIEAAGFRAIEPTAQGSDMIHGRIIEHLLSADMVLCDLSSGNANVFFELGVRTALNKPIALVIDEKSSIPFDTNGLNTKPYSSALRVWELGKQTKDVADHIEAAVVSCRGENPMWKRFGLALSAEQPVENASSTEARIELMFEQLNELRASAESSRSNPSQRTNDADSFSGDEASALDRAEARIAYLIGAKSWTTAYSDGPWRQTTYYGNMGDVSQAEAERLIRQVARKYDLLVEVSFPQPDNVSVKLSRFF